MKTYLKLKVVTPIPNRKKLPLVYTINKTNFLKTTLNFYQQNLKYISNQYIFYYYFSYLSFFILYTISQKNEKNNLDFLQKININFKNLFFKKPKHNSYLFFWLNMILHYNTLKNGNISKILFLYHYKINFWKLLYTYDINNFLRQEIFFSCLQNSKE